MDKSSNPLRQESNDGLVGGFNPALPSIPLCELPRQTDLRETIRTAFSAFPSAIFSTTIIEHVAAADATNEAQI
jgi:hypothetical protein